MRKSAFSLLAIRYLCAAVFIAAGTAKLVGVEALVAQFEIIGLGQWLRYFTGLVEVAGAIGLLFSATVPAASLSLCFTMQCAFFTHLAVPLEGGPAGALGLMVLMGIIAWSERERLPALVEVTR